MKNLRKFLNEEAVFILDSSSVDSKAESLAAREPLIIAVGNGWSSIDESKERRFVRYAQQRLS